MNRKCIGCGYCCLTATCVAGVRLYGNGAVPCPALEWRENRYYCKLMEVKGKVGEQYRKELAAGAGCCSPLNPWRREPLIDRTPKKEKVKLFSLDPIFQIFLKSISKQLISPDALHLSIFEVESELQKREIPDEEIDLIVKSIKFTILNQRSNTYDSFIGEFK